MSGSKHLGKFYGDHDNKRPIMGAGKYYHHDVVMSDGSLTSVKTNLSADDLNFLFPDPKVRLAWLRSIARMSSLPTKAR